METIGVVICNYNKQNDVLLCIQSVLENKYTDYHIYVVDNASSDDSVAMIKEKYGSVSNLTLLENSENLGGSGGFNTGLRVAISAGHPYFMCIDNDAMLDENCLGILHDFLEANDDVGIAAAKIYHTGMEDYVQQYGSFIDYVSYSVDSIYMNHLEDGTMPDIVYSDAVPACALMIKKSVVDQIGIMPEENFLYWDDTEWCIRCKEAGYKVASVGAAAACHAMGAKKEDVNTFPTYYAWRNWIVFFLSHISEDKLEDMAEAFLGTIFDIAYNGLYRNEPNQIKTVMAALDDALHRLMGKAGPDRIFELEKSYNALDRILDGKNKVLIIENKFPLYADALKEGILNKYPDIEVETTETDTSNAFVVNTATKVVISLCESIFWQDDLSLSTFRMDLDGNIIVDEEDVMKVINYNYSKRSFVFAQKPLFVLLARENYFCKGICCLSEGKFFCAL